MAINLTKGQKISLTKDENGKATNLKNCVIGLGWDASDNGTSVDCDAFVLLLHDGKLNSGHFGSKDKDIVYYGHLKHKSGSVVHCGDNLTGDGDGDDEQIIVHLDEVPAEYDKLVIAVNIYQAERKKQDFGLISNAFMRIVNTDNGKELVRYNLSDNYDGMTALVFGEIYRHNGEWKLNAIGQGTHDNSISEFARKYM